jgi:hypothetical protein
MSVSRAVAVVIVEVVDAPRGKWTRGPLPVNADALGVPGSRAGTPSERELRSTYFQKLAADRLYDARRHRPTASPFGGLDICGLELLALGEDASGGPFFLAVHAVLDPADPVGSVAALTNVRRPGLPQDEGHMRTWIQDELGVKVPDGVSRAFSVAFVTWQEAPVPEASPVTGWDPVDRWLFRLASGTASARFPLHPASREDVMSRRLRLSADWEALVLRDGAAFVGIAPDVGTPFFAPAERYVRSVYTDALLFGIAQRRMLTAIAENVAALGDPSARPAALQDVERRLTSFRNTFWWEHVTSHGHANDLLRAYRAQHRLDDLSTQVTEELKDYSAQVQTALSAQTNAFLGLLALVGLPFSVVIPIVEALDAPRDVVVAIIVVAVFAVLALAWCRPIRTRVLWPLRDLVRPT